METTVPSNNNVPTTVIPQNYPKNRARVNDVSRGLFYYISFLTILTSLILMIVAITKDELTKVTLHSTTTGRFNEFCGWHSVHFDNSETSRPPSLQQYSYSHFCPGTGHACKLEKSGKGWFGLIIIAIVLEGFALLAFVFDYLHPLTYTAVLIFDLLCFLCTLAAVLTWGIRDYCLDACNASNFIYSSPYQNSNCHGKFGVSWVLAVISGGFSLLGFVSLIISRMLTNKRY
jgi:hypothetical protein